MVIQKKKICKDCGENDIDKLFSFQRKRDSVRCICNVCKTCYSKKLRKATLGQKHSEETKEKLRQINLGKKQSKETIEKRRMKLQIPCSEEKKAKLRLSVSGFKHTLEAREKMRLAKLGHKQSKETIAKRVAKNIGKKHPSRPEGFSKKMSKIMKKAMDNPTTKEKNRAHFYNCIKNTKLGKPTSIELKIMKSLKKHNIYFERNEFISDIEHGYAADFLLPRHNVIIEADGDFWHDYPNGNDIDHIRTAELEKKGYTVLRFWEHEINDNFDMVEKGILEAL